MSLRLIQVTLPAERKKSMLNLADRYDAIDIWWESKNEDGLRTMNILVDRNHQQEVLDSIQLQLHDCENWRAVLLPVEASLPKIETPETDKTKQKKFKWRKSLTREELFQEVSSGAEGDTLYYLMVILSTIVAAIGLAQDNLAFVIAAMVIAPLLGPNLALAFGSSLGEKKLILNALRTSTGGILMAIIPCIAIGYCFDINLKSEQLTDRTIVDFAAIAVAMASGAAAVLSMTTGVSSALVGVMVSVALLPPAAAVGLFLGNGEIEFATDSLLLLITNMVCIGLSSQIVLAFMGIRPRTFLEKRQANQSSLVQISISILLLIGISLIIFFTDNDVAQSIKDGDISKALSNH